MRLRSVAAIILTALFPGTGHLALRRYLRGTVLALIWVMSAQVFIYAAFMWPGTVRSAMATIPLAAMAGTWTYAIADVLMRVRRTTGPEFQARKDSLLKQAQVAWLKDDNAIAEKMLRQILALDDRDVEAWVMLGEVLRSSGREGEARTCFLSALNLDGSQRWRWMLLQALGAVDIRAPEPEAS